MDLILSLFKTDSKSKQAKQFEGKSGGGHILDFTKMEIDG